MAYLYFYYLEKDEDKKYIQLVPKREFPHRRLFIGDVSGMFISNDEVKGSDRQFPDSKMPTIERLYDGRFHSFETFQ